MTLVAWLALLAAVAALGLAWKLNSELTTATRRLDRYNKALFDANDAIRQLRAQVEEEQAKTRVALRRLEGDAAIAPDMTIREVLMVHPQAEQVLAGFHLGGCDHCAVEPDETLAQACARNGVDLHALVGNLNGLAQAGRHAPQGAPILVKLPNVALENVALENVALENVALEIE
jgi:hybrid cluster-associated redox disulfide protein